MKKQGAGSREQGSVLGISGLQELVRRAVPPAGDEAEPERDLWPVLLHRMEDNPAATPVTTAAVPWFDWALAAAVLTLLAASPALIPVLLYYL